MYYNRLIRVTDPCWIFLRKGIWVKNLSGVSCAIIPRKLKNISNLTKSISSWSPQDLLLKHVNIVLGVWEDEGKLAETVRLGY